MLIELNLMERHSIGQHAYAFIKCVTLDPVKPFFVFNNNEIL